MDYSKIYSFLYSKGYHKDLKNHGTKYVDYICDNYNFSSILEIGCSQGMAVKSFIEKGKSCKGIDVSIPAIKESKSIGSDCTLGSVLNIPFGDNRFEAIFSCDVLEHLVSTDIDQAIKEIKRVSTKYLFLKIAFGKEINTKWADMVSKIKNFENVGNLHQTVKNREWWINSIKDDNWKLLNFDFKNMMVFENKGEN